MGHAGAIISGSSGTAAEKIAAFKKAGIGVAQRPKDFVELIQARLKGRKPAGKKVAVAVKSVAKRAKKVASKAKKATKAKTSTKSKTKAKKR